MKGKRILFGIVLIFVFVFSVGLTYAYFVTSTTGQGTDMSSSVGTLNILYTDGPEIVASGIQPGWLTTKTIKVTNTGTLKAYYSLVWASLTNEVTNDEILFSATCTSNIGSCDGLSSQPVNIDEAVAYGKPLLENEEHTYEITFMFKETGSTQNYNQDKAFNGVLNVIDAIESNTIVGTLLDSNGDPINGATLEMHSELRTGTTDTTGHFEIRGVEVGNHEITVKNSSNVTIATDTMTIESGENLGVTGKDITNITDKGILNTSIKLSNTNTIQEIKVYPSLKDKILTDNTVYADNVSSTYVSSASGINFQAKSTLINGQGLYTNNKLEDGKNKYFRGGSFCAYTDYSIEDTSGTKCTAALGTWDNTNKKCNLNSNRTTCSTQGFTYYDLNNNVTFAGKKWKIIRIDENNNIRMILAEDTVSNLVFNTYFSDNAYVGYMYGNKSLFQENITSTTSTAYILASNTYYYGTSYAKNESNLFYLTGDKISGKWDTSSICTSSSCPVANYYTCLSTSSTGTCSTLYKISSWNSSTYANVYKIDLLSQSYEQAHANITNSVAKTTIDTWYSSNLTNYRNYLTDAGYCNDRSIYTGLGYGANLTEYKNTKRNFLNTPIGPRISLSEGCSNFSNDLFTTNNSKTGNKKLANPIGLISSDEAAYAGMVYSGGTPAQYNFSNYLKFNGDYWTMTPGKEKTVYKIDSYAYFYADILVNSGGIRASISLKPYISVISGSGTYDDPYVIQ